MEGVMIVSVINAITDMIVRLSFLADRFREIADMEDEHVKAALAKSRLETEQLLEKLK